MQVERGNLCPLLQAQCKGLECAWFTQLRGAHPSTGEPVDEWGCAVAWMPVLLIENARHSRSTTAAVESLRNETVGAQQVQKLLESLNG